MNTESNTSIDGKLSASEIKRLKLPTTRKAQFFDIIKTQLNNLLKNQFLVVLLCIPLFVLLVYFFINDLVIKQTYNYTGGLLIGYPGVSDSIVDGQLAVLKWTVMKFAMLVPGIVICGPALAGLFYSLRNYVWGDYGSVRASFWKGLKLGWLQTCLLLLIDAVVLLVCVGNITLFNQMRITGTLNAWGYIAMIASILLLIATVSMSVIALPMISMYKMKLSKIIKNSFFLGLAAPFSTLIILIISALPFVSAVFVPALSVFMYMLMLFVGITLIALMWSVYTQYLTDRFFASKERNAAYGKGIYNKPKTDNNDNEDSAVLTDNTESREKNGSLQNKKKNVYANPKKKKRVDITPLRENYSRADLEKLQKEKEQLNQDDE